jgi:hypothetical protein
MNGTITIRKSTPRAYRPSRYFIREVVGGETTMRVQVDATSFDEFVEEHAAKGAHSPDLAAALEAIDLASRLETPATRGGWILLDELPRRAEIENILASIHHWRSQPIGSERQRPPMTPTATPNADEHVDLDWQDDPLEEIISSYRAYYYVDG